MDPRHFDQLSQTLAGKLRSGRVSELGAPARPAGQSAPGTTPFGPPASGICPYHDLDMTELSGTRGDAASATCGWEGLAAPSGSNARPSAAIGRATRRRQAQPLSPREQEIAALISQGLKNREIATALVLSERTVHAHVRNVLDKLGLASRAQIAAWGTEHGLLGRPATENAALAPTEPTDTTWRHGGLTGLPSVGRAHTEQ